MKNFTYHSPAKIIFGKDQINALEEELLSRNIASILLVYGRSAIKTLGIYDTIISMCNTHNITVHEVSGVRPNPEMESVRKGVTLCKTKNIPFIVAAGGGSVIDCAKAIGFGALMEEDPWDVYLHKVTPNASLPLGVIITLAATGTETNGNSVISNDETSEKRSVAYPFSIPEFAIIDPSYTLSVNKHHTIAGSIDIIMHLLEQYCSPTTNTMTSDYLITGLIESVIYQTNQIQSGNDSYAVRSNLSWASTIALNWILGVDKVGDWATHRLSYSITKEYGITHGYALAMLFTSWARVALKYNPKAMEPRLKRLGKRVFQVQTAKEAIASLERLFESWNAATSLNAGSITIDKSSLNDLIDNALALGSVGHVIEVDKPIAKEIFELSLNGNK